MTHVKVALVVLTALVAVFAAACSGTSPSGSSVSARVSAAPVPQFQALPATEDDLVVQVVAQGLEIPWEIRFLPDGALLVTERSGRILRIDQATGAVKELGRLPVAHVGEGGLLGMALDPDFPTRPYLYVMYTYGEGGVDSGLANRVSRLTLTGDPLGEEVALGEEVVLVEGIPGAGVHDGGRVAFGPDGDLWVTTGDASRGELAQDKGSLAGKVLRMDCEGRPAAGNPVGGSLVYSYGHRNPQGQIGRASCRERV
jgi:Glucose/sorbosone dehydrogenases